MTVNKNCLSTRKVASNYKRTAGQGQRRFSFVSVGLSVLYGTRKMLEHFANPDIDRASEKQI